jgi:sialic acid synthase SpsE
MDEKSAVFLDSLDVPFIKIGSGDVNNLRLLKLGKRRTLQSYFYDHTNKCEILR